MGSYNIFFIMLSVRCEIHKQMRDYLTLNQDPQEPICKECLRHHLAQKQNLEYIQLNQHSIGFFLQFTQYLIEKLETFIASIKQRGYGTTFRAGGEYSRFSFPVHTEGLLNQSCINVLLHYRTILEGNHSHVSKNFNKVENLYHQYFFNDLRQLFNMSWQIKGQSLASQIHSILIRQLPYMTSISKIPFLFHQELVNQIQQIRLKMRSQINQHSPKYTNLSVSPMEIKVQQQVRSLSQSLLLVQSFQEILSCEWDSNVKQVLQESVETLSPNFLSREDLQHHLEELLMESERLKQENYRLKFRNGELQDENASLRVKLSHHIFQ